MSATSMVGWDCGTCGKRYLTLAGLRQHLARRHPEMIPADPGYAGRMLAAVGCAMCAVWLYRVDPPVRASETIPIERLKPVVDVGPPSGPTIRCPLCGSRLALGEGPDRVFGFAMEEYV